MDVPIPHSRQLLTGTPSITPHLERTYLFVLSYDATPATRPPTIRIGSLTQ